MKNEQIFGEVMLGGNGAPSVLSVLGSGANHRA